MHLHLFILKLCRTLWIVGRYSLRTCHMHTYPDQEPLSAGHRYIYLSRAGIEPSTRTAENRSCLSQVPDNKMIFLH